MRLTLPIFTLATSLLAGCASVPADRPLAVFGNLETLEIAPLLLAAERIHQPPVTVRMGGIPNLVGDPSRANLADGPADLGTHAETQLLRYSLAHPDLRIILTVAEGHYRIVARRSAGIAQLSDLAGKRVATVKPTSSGYFLHRMLEQAGLSYDDIVLVPLGDLAEAPGIMARGEADALAIWEPHSENALRALGDDHITFSGDGVYRELFNLNSTAAALADPVRRQQIVAFVRSIILASRAVQVEPSQAWPLVARAGGFTQDEVAAAWPHQAYPASLPDDLLDVLAAEERWLAATGNRPARTREELARLIDATILAEASGGL